MTILVTGAAGHLGEGLVRTLRDRGTPVRGTDRLASPWVHAQGDLRDADFVNEVTEDCTHVIHAATLHKPHVATHGKQDFVAVNVSGTLALLEAAARARVQSFVFSSTTSVFGAAMTLPDPAREAIWVDESLTPIPKNIYGVTKRAAEDLCELFHRREGLPAIVLRTSRFFPEQDDDLDRRSAFEDENLKANELLFRRGDLADMVSAHLKALERAPDLGFGRYIVSATTPFRETDREALLRDAPAVVERYFPGVKERYAEAGWRQFPAIGRVYDNSAARRDLHWSPRYGFAEALVALERGEPLGSELARQVGKKPYHPGTFGATVGDASDPGPYPVHEGDLGRRGSTVG
jgi:UDP-glucose 4-epimerase